MNANIMEEANHKGYEQPQFKRVQNESNRLRNQQFGNNIMMAQIDVNRITTAARNVKGNKAKIQILSKGKKALEKEASALSSQIQKDVANLLNAKG
jgi:hypothetical protein